VRSPPLSADWRGSRLDDPECRCTGLVKRRETLAVAVDVPSVGAGSGVRGRKAGRRGARPPGGACEVGGRGWSSRIFRSAWTLRIGFGWWSEDVLEDDAEESDEREGFSVGGVSDRVGSTRGGAGGRGSEPLPTREREGLDRGVRERDGTTVLDVREELVAVSVVAFAMRSGWEREETCEPAELVDERLARKEERSVYAAVEGSGTAEWDGEGGAGARGEGGGGEETPDGK
jgi:hypothetical protein